MSSTIGLIFNSLIYDGSSILPFIPRFVNIISLLLVILQLPTFPLSWHFEIFGPLYFRKWMIRLRGRKAYLDEWEKERVQDGGALVCKHRMKRRVWLGQADFNLHLSNSCYALNADGARTKWMTQALGPFLTFSTGAYVALGASHFVYLKEIPVFSEYVMETRLAGYGDKWLFGVVEYIMYPKKKSSKKTKLSETPRSTTETNTTRDILSGVSDKLSLPGGLHNLPTTTVISPSPTPGLTSASGTDSPSLANLADVQKMATVRARAPRADGGVVACLAVFEACYKIDRITIPPRVVMHYALQSPDQAVRAQAKKISLAKDHGRSWLKGGWKKEVNVETLGRDAEFPESGNAETVVGMNKINEGLAAF